MIVYKNDIRQKDVKEESRKMMNKGIQVYSFNVEQVLFLMWKNVFTRTIVLVGLKECKSKVRAVFKRTNNATLIECLKRRLQLTFSYRNENKN